MHRTQDRLVRLCQLVLVAGTVLAVTVPAAGLVSLDIAAPSPRPDGPAGSTPAGSLVATEPVRPTVTEVPVPGLDRTGLRALAGDALRADAARQQDGAGRLAALSAPTPVTGYATVGVTWGPQERLGEEDITVSVRTRQQGGWSGWEQLEYHPEHAPDRAGAESAWAAELRPGTEPTVIGDVGRVQVKAVTADGEVPVDLELSVVDPGRTTAALGEPAIGTTRPSSGPGRGGDLALAAGSVAKPTIYSRAQWGADERMRDPGSLSYGTIRAGFVHHTVNANGYTSAQVPSLIRGIYAYHTQSRGWSDIGYNFVVDRFGRIWEGRYGGVAKPVVGAHTLGYNEYSFAMSAIGNFDVADPPPAMVRAYGRLFAWKLSLHGVSATDPDQTLAGRSFKAINGHRDAGSTACPGRYLYAKLPRIRTLAREAQTADTEPEPFQPAQRTADLSGSAWPDLVVRESASKRSYVVRTGGQVAFEPAEPTGRRWEEMDLIAGSRDLTGDGIADMVARNADTRMSGIYPGDGQGGFALPEATFARFAHADQLSGVRDLDGDGHNDLVARNASTKRLFLHPGDGRGGFSPRRLLARDWGYGLTQGVGDLDGDGRYDLAARTRGGEMRLFSISGGRLGAGRVLAGEWSVFDLVAGVGDLTNDGNGDIVARNAQSRLTYVYPGDGEGGLQQRLGPFREFQDLDFLVAPGQLGGGQGSDLVGREASGRLVGFLNAGRRNLGRTNATGDVLDAADLLLNVGDWNGDRHGDLMTRSARTGRLYLRMGDGTGHFGGPVLARKGFGSIRSVSPLGDVTGDGNPDLAGRPVGEPMRVYPGNGGTGFRPSVPATAEVTARLTTGSPDRYDWMLNVGDANGDRVGDLIARERATGRLWLMPGTQSGFAPRRFIGDGFGRYDLAG